MDRDRMEGKVKEGTGWAKDKAGEMTGNQDLEARGEAERTEGKAQAPGARPRTPPATPSMP
jgi:uncharacterized protein YjbJ (UPF0337 family)